MSTADHRLPTRATASAGARLGCHRHFPVVVPFLRNSYALRSIFVLGSSDNSAPGIRSLSTTAFEGRREDLPHVA